MRIDLILRRFISLLEILIAMMLVGVVISSSLFFYSYVIQVGQATEDSERANFSVRYLQNRLSYLFTHLISPQKKMQFFFTVHPVQGIFKQGTSGLVVSFDNGITLDEKFSGDVFGLLYVDNNSYLRLTTWPNRKNWKEEELPPLHDEFLLDKVDSLSFEFYVAPVKDLVLIPFTWVTEWKKEYKALPGAIKILLSRDGIPIQLTFPIPTDEATIIYTTDDT